VKISSEDAQSMAIIKKGAEFREEEECNFKHQKKKDGSTISL
jgi:hypothetical protein